MAAPTVTQIWSNTVAQDGYLIVRGKIQSQNPIKGVMSCSQFDLIIYDTTTYRNELSSAYIGRPWADFATNIDDPTSVTVPVALAAVNGVFRISSATTQTQDTITAKDDQYNATPPFSTPKMLSFFMFWSGATGTGNLLAFCRVDEFTEWSIVPSQTIF